MPDLQHNIGQQHLRRLAEQGLRLKESISRYKEKTEEVTGRVIGTFETLGGAALSGYGAGRWPNVRILSAPPDVAGGALFAGLAAFGMFGKYDEHAHNFGDGLLAGATARFFAGLGAKAASSAPPTHAISGGIFAGSLEQGRRIAAQQAAAEQAAIAASRMGAPPITTTGVPVP